MKETLARLKQNNEYLKDTAYASTLNQLAFTYAETFPDSAINLLKAEPLRLKSIGFREGEVEAYKILGLAHQTKGEFEKAIDYYERSYALAEKINYKTAIPGITNNIGSYYLNLGMYSRALEHFYKALKAAEETDNKFAKGRILNNIAIIHFFQGKLDEAEADYKKLFEIARSMRDTSGMILAYNNIGEVQLEKNNLINALTNFSMAYHLASQVNNSRLLVAGTKNLGFVYYKLDSLSKSISYFEKALQLSQETNNKPSACKALIGLATAKHKSGQLQEALAHGQKAIVLAEEMRQTQLLRDANEIVANIYEAKGNGMLALKHFRLYKNYSDSLHSQESDRAATRFKAEFEFSQKELEFQRKAFMQKSLIYLALAALVTLLIIAWIINKNRQRTIKANEILHEQNEAINKQKALAEQAFSDLKATQAQLIQAEKMASLGELTAGIAHEIQNPLNFVNNFSEVSNELIEELKSERSKKNERNETLEDEILNDIQQNLEKISHHGKRADNIVKGMLQHSRSNTGNKEPTDINALAKEYLRLSYHGLRAKDKSFNADFETNFDDSIGKIGIIPQDMGRVLLNLINNAFYAVNEKKQQNLSGYKPLVSVNTKKQNGAVEICVKDNGKGIPDNVKDKIFQPFFTTKPTGEGTGLGLSMSYDIVKAHGGELSVVSKEGEGTEFIIVLPV